MAEAQRTADELKELVQKGLNRKAMRLYYHLMSMIELKKDNFPQAIDYFKKAISLLPSQRFTTWILIETFDQALYIDPLASAYYQAGQVEKAREEYERIISLTKGTESTVEIYMPRASTS